MEKDDSIIVGKRSAEKALVKKIKPLKSKV
jgi:hypothetical protein